MEYDTSSGRLSYTNLARLIAMDRALIRGLQIAHVRHLNRTATSYVLRQNVLISGLGTKSRNSNRFFNHLTKCQSNYCANKLQVKYLSTDSQEKQSNLDKKLIYYGVHRGNVRMLKFFSYTMSCFTLAVQPLFFDHIMKMSIPACIGYYSSVGFFSIVVPVLLHLVTKNYITEILYDTKKDSYIFKTISFYLTDKAHESVKLDDICRIDKPTLFTTFYIKGRPVIMTEDAFLHKEFYIKMMGYDKPMDFRFNLKEREEIENSKEPAKIN